ncbi:MAG TPA: xanthine dehydrogenase small subunit, partial [Burkholderiaceae bacterium]
HAHCTGTKEGCAEGDCGACTVLVAELDAHGELQLANVNSCTQFLPTLDGRALLTVEDVGGPETLSPVQQAMVECHGSQCGFCTPGFVMSLTHEYERHCAAGTRPDRQQLADALAGNLCRCTGYRPILDAGQRMFELPPQRIDRAVLKQALSAINEPPLHYAAPSALDARRQDRFDAPRHVAELARLYEARPQARLLAGSTDIGLWVNKQFKDVGDLIYVGRVQEMLALRDEGSQLHIGAAVPLEDAWGLLAQRVPALRELWLRFASPPVRRAGTLGGNIANGSPIGDGAPALMALGCELLLRRGSVTRQLALEDFYLDYMKNALQPGEFIEAMRVQVPDASWQVRGYKVSKRYDSDISAVCAGLAIRLEAGRVAEVRLAFGGMAATVRRAAQAEAALLNQRYDEANLEAAIAALARDFTPLSDMRASAAYRARVAGNLLRRFWLETRADAPLSARKTSVFLHGSHA